LKTFNPSSEYWEWIFSTCFCSFADLMFSSQRTFLHVKHWSFWGPSWLLQEVKLNLMCCQHIFVFKGLWRWFTNKILLCLDIIHLVFTKKFTTFLKLDLRR
jgi:hypothetical protein